MSDSGANDLPGSAHTGNECLVDCVNDLEKVSALHGV
jgi:hypothetical protein